MKTKFWLGGLALVLLIALGSFLDLAVEPWFERGQVEMFQKNLTDQIPIGTPKDQVVEYLKNNHYDYSIEKNGVEIVAADHGISRSPFILQDYQVILDLGPTGRLARVQLVQVSSGR